MKIKKWINRFDSWLTLDETSFSFPLDYEEVKELKQLLQKQKRDNLIKAHLEAMDERLLIREGSTELTHEEAKQALRNIYLIVSGHEPEKQVG